MGTAMTGAVVGALLGAVTKSVMSLVGKVLENTLETWGSHSLHEDIGYIKRELQMLVAAEEQLLGSRDLSPVELVSMEQMRDLLQDIEDCLDKILRYSSKYEAEAPSVKLQIMKAVAQTRRHPFGKKVKTLKAQLKEAHQTNANYNVVYGSQSVGTSSTTTTTNSPANVDPVGIDKPKRDILELLNDVEVEDLKVISVVGFGGSGKSTLAKAVYDCPDIASRFPDRVWLVASEYRGNNTGLLKALLEKLSPGHPAASRDDADQLLIDITKCLKTKRYLIVFDDIEEQQWHAIKFTLPQKTRSRIIVTTKVQALAQVCCNHGNHGYVYNMRSLDEKHSKELLEALMKRALPGLEQISTLIVKKCDGHPLTLFSVANYLLRKTEFTESECNFFLSNLGSHMAEESSPFRDLQQILLNNYRSLPGRPVNLKTCLLYLCVFPNGHAIRRSNLMRRWIAEGYVCDPDPCKALLKADKSLDKLIDRHIIRPIDPSKNAKVKTCRAHGIMHEFILHMSKNAKFVTSVRDPERGRYRHLFMEDHCQVLSDEKLRAHSLTICGSAGEAPFDFTKCEFLRVLDLEECSDLKDYHIAGIHKLWHLKYLSLGGTITRLPSKIKKLHCLETLDMRKASRAEKLLLPVEILKLPHLAHLLGRFKLGKRKWKMRKLEKFLPKECSLQTLAGFVTDGNPGFPILMVHMKRLRKVKIWCNDEDSKSLAELSKCIEKFIEHELDTSIGVRSLSLHVMSSSENSILHYLGNRFGYLSSLKLHGALSGLTQFATSPSLRGLTELCLSSTNDLVTDDLSSLRRLIHLEYLKLVNVSLESFAIKSGDFPRLQRLCLVQNRVTTSIPTIDKEAIPNLISLRLLSKDLVNLSGIEIRRFEHLQEVALDSEINQEAKRVWEDAARNHPKRPRVLYLRRIDPQGMGSVVKYVAASGHAPASSELHSEGNEEPMTSSSRASIMVEPQGLQSSMSEERTNLQERVDEAKATPSHEKKKKFLGVVIKEPAVQHIKSGGKHSVTTDVDKSRVKGKGKVDDIPGDAIQVAQDKEIAMELQKLYDQGKGDKADIRRDAAAFKKKESPGVGIKDLVAESSRSAGKDNGITDVDNSPVKGKDKLDENHEIPEHVRQEALDREMALRLHELHDQRRGDIADSIQGASDIMHRRIFGAGNERTGY